MVSLFWISSTPWIPWWLEACSCCETSGMFRGPGVLEMSAFCSIQTGHEGGRIAVECPSATRNMCRIMYFQSGIGAHQQRLKLPDGRLVQVEGPDSGKSLVPWPRLVEREDCFLRSQGSVWATSLRCSRSAKQHAFYLYSHRTTTYWVHNNITRTHTCTHSVCIIRAHIYII